MPIMNRCGPPVTGENFLFREVEILQAEQLLRNGNSFKLFSLRRIGKSSLLKELQRRAEERGDTHFHYCDLEGKNTPTEFFRLILGTLPKDAESRIIEAWSKSKTVPANVLSALAKRIKGIQIEGSGVQLERDVLDYWEPLAHCIETILPKVEKPVTVLLDEMPFFIEDLINNGYGPHAAENVLASLRLFRGAGLQMVFCGSIGMNHILDKHGINRAVVNDMTSLSLEPFSLDEAKDLLNRLAKAAGAAWWREETTEATLLYVKDWLPYFLQFSFNEVLSRGAGNREDVETVYVEHIRPGLIKDFIQQFEYRLRTRYSAEERVAVAAVLSALLKAEDRRLSREKAGESIEPDLEPRLLINQMIENGFLKEHPETGDVEFALHFIAEWWGRQ